MDINTILLRLTLSLIKWHAILQVVLEEGLEDRPHGEPQNVLTELSKYFQSAR